MNVRGGPGGGEVAGWARPPAALIHQARVRALSLSPPSSCRPIHHSRHQHAAAASQGGRGENVILATASSSIPASSGDTGTWAGVDVETAAEFLRVGVWAEAAASLLSRVTAMAGKKRNQYTLVRVIFRARPGRDVASTVQCQAGSYLGPETRTHSGQH